MKKICRKIKKNKNREAKTEAEEKCNIIISNEERMKRNQL